MPWFGVRKGIYRFLPGLTRVSDPVVERSLARLPAGARIADLGAGGRRLTPQTFTIDGFVGEGTDLTCDIHAVPLPDASFDAVFCTGTLEHVENPPVVLSEIRRLLAPGGLAHIEVPFLQPYHADPADYWRWTLPGLELLCTRAGFEKIESGAHIGPASALNWVMNELALSVAGRGRVGTALALGLRVAGFPLLALDRFARGAAGAAAGVYFVGRRP